MTYPAIGRVWYTNLCLEGGDRPPLDASSIDNEGRPSGKLQFSDGPSARAPSTRGYGMSARPKLPDTANRATNVGPAEPFPVPGTPEWGEMNRRRGELIRKKVQSGLTPEEQAEYEYLQKASLAAVDKAHPRPPVDLAGLQQFEAELRQKGK